MERDIPRQQDEKEPYASRLAIQYSGTLAQQLTWNRMLLADAMRAADMRSNVIIRSSHAKPRQVVPTSDVLVLADKRISRQNQPSVKACLLDERAVITPRFEYGQLAITIHDQVIQQAISDRKGDWNSNYCKELNSVVRDSMKIGIAVEKAYQHMLADNTFSEALLTATVDLLRIGVTSGIMFGSSLAIAYLSSKVHLLYPDDDMIGKVFTVLTIGVTGYLSFSAGSLGVIYLRYARISNQQNRYVSVVPPYITSLSDTIHPNIDMHKLNGTARLMLPGKQYVSLKK